jgi:hypothetical protein
MPPLKILEPEGTFEGRGYPDLIQEWFNWFVSSSPDYQSSENVLFLRGDLDYDTGKGDRLYKESKGLLKLDETIYSNTLVFIPVMTAMYALNEMYEGKQLLDEASLRYAVRKETFKSPKVWLRYQTATAAYTPVLPQNEKIQDYYFETPKFILNVKSDNPFRQKFAHPMAPDNYEAVGGGYYVALKNLKSDTYRFHFGGIGRGSYRTDVFCDISVLNQVTKPLTKDVSSEDPTPKLGSANDPKLKKFIHLKNEDEINSISPL